MSSRRARRRKLRKVFKDCVNRIIPTMIELLEEELTRKKRLWSRKWILRRCTHGAAAGLLRELECEDTTEYRLFLRMDSEQFDNLLRSIAPLIQRADAIMRDVIRARDKLQIALSFLATGNSFRTLQHLFRVLYITTWRIILR
jgi:hypothetical protein